MTYQLFLQILCVISGFVLFGVLDRLWAASRKLEQPECPECAARGASYSARVAFQVKRLRELGVDYAWDKAVNLVAEDDREKAKSEAQKNAEAMAKPVLSGSYRNDR